MSEYLVEVKRSARKSNAAVGSVVCQRGVRHRFDSRAEAESWATDLADEDATVWIRASNPDDRSDVDAYLIGWLHRVTAAGAELTEETPGEQAWLAEYQRGLDETADESAGNGAPTPLRGGERITDWLASE